MAMTTRSAAAVLLLFALLAFPAAPAQAILLTLAASGTISENSSGDPTISVGTPWSFQFTYNTSAPDLDPDPTSGRFTNTAAPPAMTFFHYRAGTYEVTLDDPLDFGTLGGIFITFTSINGIDINIFAPNFFPPLAGGPVSFHSDFARFTSPPIFSSNALPTNTALGPGSFGDSNVTLLPPAGVVTGSSLTSLTLTATPRGDFNRDGHVNAADIPAMLTAMADSHAFKTRNGLSDAQLHSIGDIDSSDSITNADINALIGLLRTGGGSLAPVPEPASIVLTVMALPGVTVTVVCRRGKSLQHHQVQS